MIESFTEKRHARTGVCIKKNHNWLFVVVTHTYEADRNHSNIDTKGFSIREFSHLMKEMECIDAINLDGGYSSTLVIDNKVINTPVGQWNGITHAFEEQAVGDAILIFKR